MSIAFSNMQGKESLWALCLQDLQETLGNFAFNSWISPLVYLGLDDGVATLQVPNEMVRSWVEKHYCGVLLDCFRKVDDSIETVCLSVAGNGLATVPELDAAVLRSPRIPAPATKPVRKSVVASLPAALPEGFYPHYRFENFVEGECNRLALTVSKTVANQPGSNKVNPLILYGGTGLGKTHLLQSIGSYAIEHETAHRVLYRTAEQFLKDYMRLVVRGQDYRQFYELYCNADILLIDDIQILAGKTSTQEELFKVLNRLLAQKKQIVLCSDQLPSQVPGLSKHLLERFAGGMSCSLEAPDLQTRIAILERKAVDLQMPASQTEEILRWLASHHGSNVRELEGVVVKLLAFHDLLGYELDLDTVRQMLGDVVRDEPGSISIRDVAEATSLVFGIQPEVLSSRTRIKNVSLPRKIALFLCRELTDNSLQTIGMHFNRDYSTVIASLKTAEELIATDLVVQARVAEIRRMLARA